MTLEADADGRPTTGALLQVHVLQLGPIGTNCYVVHEAGSTRAFVVDPGAEHERVLELLDDEGLEVEAILATHFHYDHVGGIAGLAAATGAPVWMHADEAYGLETPEVLNAQWPGGRHDVTAWPVEHRLRGGERIEVAGIALDVLLVPGHSPAHIAFIAPGTIDADGVVDTDAMPPLAFSGDVLFQGSVGRTDLPGSDQAQLVRSLQLMVRKLDPSTLILSGHGPVTQLEAEVRTNPFLRGI